jgi:hypothetical protein
MSESYIKISTCSQGLEVDIDCEDFDKFKSLLYTVFCGSATDLIFDLVYEILYNQEDDQKAQQIKVLQILMNESKTRSNSLDTSKNPVVKPSAFK